jgi:hypothetical protein
LNSTLVTQRGERQRTGRSARGCFSTAASAFFAAAAAIEITLGILAADVLNIYIIHRYTSADEVLADEVVKDIVARVRLR